MRQYKKWEYCDIENNERMLSRCSYIFRIFLIISNLDHLLPGTTTIKRNHKTCQKMVMFRIIIIKSCCWKIHKKFRSETQRGLGIFSFSLSVEMLAAGYFCLRPDLSSRALYFGGMLDGEKVKYYTTPPLEGGAIFFWDTCWFQSIDAHPGLLALPVDLVGFFSSL